MLLNQEKHRLMQQPVFQIRIRANPEYFVIVKYGFRLLKNMWKMFLFIIISYSYLGRIWIREKHRSKKFNFETLTKKGYLEPTLYKLISN